VQIALSIEEMAAPAQEFDASESAPEPSGRKPKPETPARQLQREMAVFEVADDQPVAMLIPFRFSGASAIAVLIETTDASQNPQFDQTLSAMSAHLKTSRQADAAASGDPVLSGLRSALLSLGRVEARRAVLVFLADQTQASICQDIALVADDATLAALTERVQAGTSNAESVASVDAIGWVLDRSALSLLAEQSAEGKLPPELAAVLSSQAGEAGRRADSLEEVLRGAGSRKDLAARLVAENLIYLEDPSPGARVRAYDWLSARKLAPEGYDPMGDVRQRREALERALVEAVEAKSNE
jgi:hypothetical protein